MTPKRALDRTMQRACPDFQCFAHPQACDRTMQLYSVELLSSQHADLHGSGYDYMMIVDHLRFEFLFYEQENIL